ncbi:hypothetical protein NYE25_08140 [Paenibacillus sp. FSL E2-8871]|uniref:hypothetical protein n=1 Tax=Paenibacillus sp. FSL E2-8871 TaxID=2975326 RepID=UPI0030F9B993
MISLLSKRIYNRKKQRERYFEKIREATKEEMIEIYKMGYDVWGDNLPYEEYITMCQASKKYRKGK